MDDNLSEVILDPAKTALLVIDVQRALFTKSTPIYRADELVQTLNSLVNTWKNTGGLVVFIQHSNNKSLVKGTPDWKLHPDLAWDETDIVIHKLHGNAFEKTNLKGLLDSKGITDIVITGLVTHGCVKATCIGGSELGYRVALVTDAHSNYSKDAARIIEEWNQKLGDKYADLVAMDGIRLTG